MNQLVKILVDDNGEKIEEPKWCLVVNWQGSKSFCSDQFFGYGESSVVFKTKESERGITCERCKEKIKEIKAVKL